MSTYRTFKRSYKIDPTHPHIRNNFLNGRKMTEETGLTYQQALERCKEFNDNRTAAQKRKGTMLEFESE